MATDLRGLWDPRAAAVTGMDPRAAAVTGMDPEATGTATGTPS